MTDDLDVEQLGESLDGADPHDADDIGRAEHDECVKARTPRDPKRHGRSTTRARVPKLLPRLR